MGVQGFVKNYKALIVCRVILGFFEAGGLVISLMIRVGQLMR